VAAPPPKSLILDLYGAYGRQVGGWLAVADLVRLMADLGQERQAARSAISRMKKGSLLAAETRSGVAGYALTDEATEILHQGDQRIFHSNEPADLADGWTIVIFSVPEEDRDRRYQLRSRLVWLGFGQVAPGVWIAPTRTFKEVTRLLSRSGVSQYVTIFKGDYRGFKSLKSLVASTWDLRALEQIYEDFIDEHQPLLRAWSNRSSKTDADAFVDYMTTLSVWRRLPYLDPGLPPEILPARWAGRRARELFAAIHQKLERRGYAHVLSVLRAR
jgi:phenylacetic acid degradation operon negative regulatory protein